MAERSASSSSSTTSESYLTTTTASHKEVKIRQNEYHYLPTGLFVFKAVDACCLGFLSLVDWMILISIYPTSYWHLLNAFNLGFSTLAVVGLGLCWLLIPCLMFIPFIWRRLLSRDGFISSRLVSFLFYVFATIINQYSRTVFTGLAGGLVVARLVISNSLEEHLATAFGFVIHSVMRWSFSTVNPLDIVGYNPVDVIFFLLGIVAFGRYCSSNFNFPPPAYRQNLDPFPLITTYPLPSHTSANDKEMPLASSDAHLQPYSPNCLEKVLYGLFGTIGTSCAIFILCYMYASNSLLVRWNSQDPRDTGYLVVLMLALGFLLLLSIFTVDCTSFSKKCRFTSPMLYALCWMLCFTGGIFVIVMVPSYGSFVAGCIMAVGILSMVTVCLSALQHSILHITLKGVNFKRTLAASMLVLVFGILQLLFFVIHVAWFTGPMVPGFGFFFDEVHLLWLIPFFFFIVSAFGLIILMFVARFRHHNDESTVGMARKSYVQMAMGFIVSLGFVLLFLMLPAARWQEWASQRIGAADTEIPFTVMTWNIQEGFSLFDYPRGAGFLAINKDAELIRSYKPHFVGLQETDASHLLHGDRDLVHFLAQRTGLHAYYGPPSYIASAGVATFTAGKLINPEYILLPREDEPLNRFLTHGIYHYKGGRTKDDWFYVNVLNTHASAFSPTARRVQMERIKKYVERVSGPLVLLGDMNGNPQETQALWNATAGGGPLKLVKFSDNPLDSKSLVPTEITNFKHIDHIYYRELCLLDRYVVPVSGYSDHLPVTAKFMKVPLSGECPAL